MRIKAGTIVTMISIPIILILSAAFISAQESEPAVRESGGMGYSIFGKGRINIDDLNTKLKSKGYAGLSDDFFCVGGGGHSIINDQFVLGGEALTLFGNDAVTGNYRSSISVAYGFFDFGYIVLSEKDFRVYPFIGIGGGKMNFTIAEDVESISIDEVLDDPGRKSEFSTGGFLFNMGIGADYLIKFSEDETGRGGMLLGVRAGYTFAPFKSGWSMGDIEIAGAPETGITGPYVRVIIGGGGIGVEE